MLRFYKDLGIDGDHRLVGTPSDFSTVFSSNIVETINDAGKFLQPNAKEVVTPYFTDFKSVSIVESVVNFTDQTSDYTFFRVTGYEFLGIYNIKFYIVVDPFLTFNISVTGLIYQTGNYEKYKDIYEMPVVHGNSVKKKSITPVAGYDTGDSAYRYRAYACLSTNDPDPNVTDKSFLIIRTPKLSQFYANEWAVNLAMNNAIKRRVISTVTDYTYEVLHIYLLPAEIDFGEVSGQEYSIDNFANIWHPIRYTNAEKDYSISLTKSQYNAEIGTLTKRIKLPDYRLFEPLISTISDVEFPVRVEGTFEYGLTLRLYANNQSIEITSDFEKDLEYSPEAQYEVFKAASQNIRTGAKLAVAGVSVISSAVAQNYMGAISGAVNIGADIANIWANKIERDKQVGIVEEKQGNCFENLSRTMGIGLFYDNENDLENLFDVQSANFLYGYIPINLITANAEDFTKPASLIGNDFFYYKFNFIVDISGGNIPADYNAEIRNDLLRGVFIKHY